MAKGSHLHKGGFWYAHWKHETGVAPRRLSEIPEDELMKKGKTYRPEMVVKAKQTNEKTVHKN